MLKLLISLDDTTTQQRLLVLFFAKENVMVESVKHFGGLSSLVTTRQHNLVDRLRNLPKKDREEEINFLKHIDLMTPLKSN